MISNYLSSINLILEACRARKKVAILSLLEVIISIIGRYVPLLILPNFIDAFLVKNRHEYYINGFCYFFSIVLFKVIEKCIIALRNGESCNSNECTLNDIGIKIHRIPYEQCMKYDMRQKYLGALDVIEYEFDYKDVIDEIIKIFEGVLNVICSLVFAASLMFAKPQSVYGIPYYIANPITSGMIFLVAVLLQLYRVRNYNKSVETINNQLVENHIKIENKISYLRDKVIYNFSQYMQYHIFSMGKMLDERFDEDSPKNIEYFMKSRNNKIKKQLRIDIDSAFITMITSIIIIAKYLTGAIGISYFVTYLEGILIMHSALIQVADSAYKIGQFQIYFKSISDIMDCPNEKSIGDKLEKRSPKEIVFDHVFFKYENAKDYALKDFCCKLSGDKKHAIVGYNGSGKSTLLLLLVGILKPQEGHIYIDGIDIENYSAKEYRELFSFMQQEAFLFPTFIKENIALDITYDDNRTKKAAEECGLPYSIINCEKNDREYSGGERQKICAGRAFYRNAPIYVFDEPTSAMDPISEAKFYEKLLSESIDKFVIFVSHRLSSCRDCDDILVLNNGELVERGNHFQLLHFDGIYKNLWNSQKDVVKTYNGF